MNTVLKWKIVKEVHIEAHDVNENVLRCDGEKYIEGGKWREK
jgi:hypothetical protein